MRHAGKALEARIRRKLGHDLVSLLPEDELQTGVVAHAAAEAALVDAAVVEPVVGGHSPRVISRLPCRIFCHMRRFPLISVLRRLFRWCLWCGDGWRRLTRFQAHPRGEGVAVVVERLVRRL